MSNFSVRGVVLKRTNVGEMDRLVTLFSREKGKLTCIAKGSRKLSSSKLGALEPGSESKVYCVETKSLPILTQAQLLEDFRGSRESLVTIKKLFQTLEIIDCLLPEGDPQIEVYEVLRRILQLIASPSSPTAEIRVMLERILAILGYDPQDRGSQRVSVQTQVEELTARHLKSFDYLTLSSG